MPGEMDIIEDPHSGKNGGHQKSVGGSRKLLQLFRLKSLRWRSKTDDDGEKEKKQSPDERRDQLDRDMKNNWEQLPATLRRRKEKLSQAVLDQFTEDVAPVEDEIQPDLHTVSNKQDNILQNVSDESSHQSSLEDIQLSADKYSEKSLFSEQDSPSVESQKTSSTSSQIIVRPQIHRECSDSSLECLENMTEGISVEPNNNIYLSATDNLEAGVKTEIEIKAEVKKQKEGSEEQIGSNTETHKFAQIDTQLEEKSGSQPEVVSVNYDERNVVVSCFSLEGKDGVSPLSKSDNCTDLNVQSSNSYDENKTDLSQSGKISETSDLTCSKKYDSENKTELQTMLLPNESYLYNSNYKDQNISGDCELSTSSTDIKLSERKGFDQEASRINTTLSYEEEQVMSLLSQAVSEDSLLIPSSPSSTSASSVSSSTDERNHDSGTDINSPSPSTSSCSTETTCKVVTDTTSHYKNPKLSLRPIEIIDKSSEANPNEAIHTLVTSSQDIGGSTDSGIEKSLHCQSRVGSPPSSPISKNNVKSKFFKHNENSKFLPSSNSSCCFSSLSDEPSLYEVVIPRAEYHKSSHIALKTVEYQTPRDKSLHEVHHDMTAFSSRNEDKLLCDYKSKTQNQSAKSVTKLESLGRDEENVMSYYDAVVQEGHTSNLKLCDDNTDTFGNCPLHQKSKKPVIEGKEYEYVAKGLYINDCIDADIRNQKSACNERNENGHMGKGNAFTKPYAAMEFAKSAGNCIDLSKENSFTESAIDSKDKMCPPDAFGSKWKRQLGLETLNKKPLTMATIMEERESEADNNANTANTSDSEKLTVREILRRFEELGGRVQLPTDITQAEVDNDAENSATLREIQETLRCLEEKVRHYETKAATTQTQDADEAGSGEKVEHTHSFITLFQFIYHGKV
jgi:hypothetical protein